jgi:murein DD-endopeptidase MepM/ murein hydrolase activator NlpD
MVQIDIHIPRPLLTLGIIAAVISFVWFDANPLRADAMGGGTKDAAYQVQEAEANIRRLREEQDVLSRREQILRGELEAIEQELTQTDNQVLIIKLLDTRERLLKLLDDREAGEQEILLSLRQIWDAQGVAIAASQFADDSVMPDFFWPVEPTLGVSANFHDAVYRKRFGMEHNAIDIPVLQGSVVFAAADGVVEKVSDNGLGYSSLVIRHSGGYATLYGHVSGFLVEEGDQVRAGDPVVLSGGTPGTQGAGRMTTGAHLHFELIHSGEHIDPLTLLPARL